MQDSLENVIVKASEVVVGKRHIIRLALACLVARGHLLIEDLPGVGKTMLTQVLAKLLGLRFNRIQFTSDLLPADILGVAVYERGNGQFKFHPGPIFAQVVLADEINRATPKAQSALLEAMEERQVTVEGETRELPAPFFIIATQNPAHQIGTFPLPESQLDRFLMRLEMGYPDAAAERALLQGADRRDLLAELEPCLEPAQLVAMQHAVPRIHVAEALLDYVQALLAQTRRNPEYRNGLSPRAGLAMLRGAQAWTLLDGREHVVPEDVQAVLPAIIGHRLRPAGELHSWPSAEVARALVEAVPIP